LSIFIGMRKFFVFYNEMSQKIEDWAFEYIVPPSLKAIEIVLRFTMLYAFYLLVKNGIKEAM